MREPALDERAYCGDCGKLALFECAECREPYCRTCLGGEPRICASCALSMPNKDGE